MSGALLGQVWALADDVGRWNRFVTCEDAYTAVLVKRICGHVETLRAMVAPTAAERYRALVAEGLGDEEALAEALAAVDGEAHELHFRLCLDRDGVRRMRATSSEKEAA
jgi:hypothetical protein